MEPIFVRALSRRHLLALGAAGLGSVTATRVTQAAANATASVLPGMRPEPVGRGAASCAACGEVGHTAWDGFCLSEHPRRRS